MKKFRRGRVVFVSSAWPRGFCKRRQSFERSRAASSFDGSRSNREVATAFDQISIACLFRLCIVDDGSGPRSDVQQAAPSSDRSMTKLEQTTFGFEWISGPSV